MSEITLKAAASLRLFSRIVTGGDFEMSSKSVLLPEHYPIYNLIDDVIRNSSMTEALVRELEGNKNVDAVIDKIASGEYSFSLADFCKAYIYLAVSKNTEKAHRPYILAYLGLTEEYRELKGAKRIEHYCDTIGKKSDSPKKYTKERMERMAASMYNQRKSLGSLRWAEEVAGNVPALLTELNTILCPSPLDVETVPDTPTVEPEHDEPVEEEAADKQVAYRKPERKSITKGERIFFCVLIAVAILGLAGYLIDSLLSPQNDETSDQALPDLGIVSDYEMLYMLEQDLRALEIKNESLAVLREKAETGNAERQFIYAVELYLYEEYEESAVWFKASADQGYVYAQASLCPMYMIGQGVEIDYDKMFYYATEADKQGEPEGTHYLGLCYLYGYGVDQNYSLAVETLQRAVDDGCERSMATLGGMYLSGAGVERDYARALNLLKESYEKGYPFASYLIGMAYLNGLGVKEDIETAIKWLRISADIGLSQACFYLGEIYYRGEGVDRNYEEAFTLFKKSAEQGYAFSQFALSEMYINGYGSHKDEEEGIRWLTLSAENGLAEAQYQLGMFYFIGEIVEEDFSTAMDWLVLAAGQEEPHATELLGKLGIQVVAQNTN